MHVGLVHIQVGLIRLELLPRGVHKDARPQGYQTAAFPRETKVKAVLETCYRLGR